MSPLEQFEVINYIGLRAPIIGSYFLSLTNLGFYSLITVLITIVYHLQSNQQLIIPNQWRISLESSLASIHNMVKEQLGQANEIYLPFIYSLFFFILISNLSGNVPYSFAVGTRAIVSLGLRFTIFLGVTILGLQKHKVHFFSYFVPNGTPIVLVPLLVLIEMISYLARAFSLGIRLFANLVAGHTLLKILSGFLYPALSRGIFMFILTLLPLRIFVALTGLEIAVSFIQAYVFTILTCIYIKDSIDLH